MHAFCNHKVLIFLSFLTFLFAIFNNNPYSTYVNNFSIVSFDIIRPLRIGRLCDKQGFTKFLTILPNCSVGVTAAVDKYVNSSICFFGFYDLLWFTLALNILGPLTCLMTSGSINSIETTNPLFMLVSLHKRVHQCINAITFKFGNNSCPRYLNEVYEYAPQCSIESRSNFAKLKVPFRKINI